MNSDTEYDVSDAAGDWPEAMERGRVADAAFAAAYARVPDQRRALVKTGLAAVYAACGGPMPRFRRRSAGLGHDLGLACLDVPLDFAVVVCGRSFASPARLAAAVVPALCARVPEVAAVRVGDRWPQALLVTLELCGVETACRLGTRSLAGLWPALAARGHGAVICLDGVSPPPAVGRLRVLTAQTAGRAGLFPGPDATFDREALAFAHPDLEFFVHGESGPEESGPFRPAQGTLAQAAGQGYDVIYAGEKSLARAMDAAPLALGPGRETFWLWPELSAEVFRRRHVAAAADTDVAAFG